MLYNYKTKGLIKGVGTDSRIARDLAEPWIAAWVAKHTSEAQAEQA